MSIFSNIPGAPSIPAPALSQPSPSPTQNAVSAPLAPVTIDDLKAALPTNLKSAVSQTMVDTLNGISQDPLIAQSIRDNVIGYSSVMKEGKFKAEDYVHAVAYVGFKLMGDTNQDAYAKTFPKRYAALVAAGRSSKDIAAYVAAYHKGKLVNLIMEQSLVPTWVLNQDLHQQAINQLAYLMKNASSEKVQADSAIGLLAALKKPDAAKGQLTIDIAESTGMREMKDLLTQLAQGQQQAIAAGAMKTIDVAGARLIDKAEAQDV